MKNIYAVIVTLFFACLHLGAQELEPSAFRFDESDLEAKLNPVLDLNGVPGALVRVQLPSAEVSFEGNLIETPKYEKGEWLIYLPAGTEKVKILLQGYNPLEYVFPVKLESYCSYVLSVHPQRLENVHFLFVPSYSIGMYKQSSWGLMLAIGRKHGGYVKGKLSPETIAGSRYDVVENCDSNGMVDGLQSWLTGNASTKRFAVTGGYMFRAMRFGYIYGGCGYGERELLWEKYDGKYASVSDISVKGLEAEAGILFNFGNVVFGLGVQTNQFKYVEGSISFGVIF